LIKKKLAKLLDFFVVVVDKEEVRPGLSRSKLAPLFLPFKG